LGSRSIGLHLGLRLALRLRLLLHVNDRSVGTVGSIGSNGGTLGSGLDGLSLLESLRESVGSVLALSIGDVAEEHGIHRGIEHTHEERGNDIGQDEDDDHGHDSGEELTVVESLHDETATTSSDEGNADLTEEDDEAADKVKSSGTTEVGQDEGEGTDTRGAEVLTGDCRPDKSIARDVINALLAALEAALDAAEDATNHTILRVLGLSLDISNHGTDELDDGDDKRTESHSTEMVEDGALHRAGNRGRREILLTIANETLGSVVRIGKREIPLTNGASRGHVGGVLDELGHPEEMEEVIDEDILESVVPSVANVSGIVTALETNNAVVCIGKIENVRVLDGE